MPVSPLLCSRFLNTVLANALRSHPAEITAAAAVQLQYTAPPGTPASSRVPVLLALRRSGESAEHAAALFCGEHGVSECSELVAALQWHRRSEGPSVGQTRVQLIPGAVWLCSALE